ncbi:hypothetical protein D3C75_1154030 [compost metagenome]
MGISAFRFYLGHAALQREKLLQQLVGPRCYNIYGDLDMADMYQVNYFSADIDGDHGSKSQVPVVIKISGSHNDETI